MSRPTLIVHEKSSVLQCLLSLALQPSSPPDGAVFEKQAQFKVQSLSGR